ncbi:MAG: addiction module protein [Verrucomicrobiales bacterium]|jgi:hypothetical protein|nr:addiction module protein [Verrucomicrobiales bacterium]
MIAAEEIHAWSREEKWRVMETIWDDLRQDEARAEIPDEHRKILAERECLEQAGRVTYLPWKTARQELQEYARKRTDEIARERPGQS